MALTIATYNVLATAYINPQWYPFCTSESLDPLYRIPALIDHLVRLQADVLCLQEVEEPVYAAAETRLAPLGYAGSFTRKRQGKPDACATFIQTGVCERVEVIEVEYRDAVRQDGPEQSDSGHIAQIVVLKNGQRFLGVANTHLKWDVPEVPDDQQFAYRQMTQLLMERNVLAPQCQGWVICGDFNVTAESGTVRILREAGFEFSHARHPRAATSNANRRAKMIDFIFYDGALNAEPLPLPAVNDKIFQFMSDL